MDAREPPMPPRIGRYRIERLLGRGAMGRVLLGRDQVLDRDVAVKLLRDDLAIGPEQKAALIDRMRHEAKACARVTHPNIVALFDMGEDESVGLYLVFEYAEGITLKDRLARGPLPIALAAKMAREIGGALSTAHATGVLHRDVKPENIILTEHGSKVADFGIARVPDSTLTRDGGLLGTPAYSAPECIANGSFSASSDQFSFAATMYEALSQRRAFPGEDAVTVATRIQSDEPPAIAEACGLDPHVDGVLARGLSKDPERRFPSAGEFGDALAEALQQGNRRAQPTLPDMQHRYRVGAPSSTTRSAVGGAAIGALLAIAALQLTSGLREREAEREPLPLRAEPPARAIAWLSPAAREQPRPAPSASVRTRAPAAAPSASAVPAASAAAPDDAGSEEPTEADAGAESDVDAGH
jgi:eukaryotic-like serine/threonine-protein kinase